MTSFGLVYLFVHPFSHTCNIGHISYRLQFIYYNTTCNIWTSTQYNIINNNTKFKAQLEVESVTTSTLYLDLGARRGWGVSVTPRLHSTLGKTRYPLYRRLGGHQGRSGKSCPHRDSIPGPSSPQPVTIPTELPGPQMYVFVYKYS
jgi:hypothetical protein